jgi:hypothetical protein
MRSFLGRVARWFVFQTKNPDLGKFWSALDWKTLIYFMDNWNILTRFGKFHGHSVHFSGFWYHAPGKIWQPCFLAVLQARAARFSRRANISTFFHAVKVK